MDKQQKKGNSRLRHQRELLGWTQGMLAQKIGTTVVNISCWENGSNPGPYFRRKLCEVFNKKADELDLVEAEEAVDQAISIPPTALWSATVPDEPYYPLPGREKDLERLLAVLQEPQGPLAITLDGLGGQGKTAMAVELSRRALRLGSFEGLSATVLNRSYSPVGKSSR